jgi:predicted dehydrogenase
LASKLRWGVLSTAKIGTVKVLPAMQRGEWTTVAAIASRDLARAQSAAAALGVPVAYGSYGALLDDPSIDAIYNPLPNHLHVEWTIRAVEAGKHVLCEKPIGLSAADVQRLIAARDRTGRRIQEAFMVVTHPQWLRARDLVQSGRLGALRTIIGGFSYMNADATNIRNVAAYGGGALFDIGCYFVTTSRFMFGGEPRRVIASIERDPTFHVDRRTSIVLEYDAGTFVGTCGTQITPYQRIEILGSDARLEIEIPFNAPPDRPCRLFFDARGALDGSSIETIEIPTCDQYTIQGDLFSRAILDGTTEPYPLEESRANLRVIDALFRSAEDAAWVTVTE